MHSQSNTDTQATRKARRQFLRDAAVFSTALISGDWSASAAAALSASRETDVLIIGAGIAGICSAIEAADSGARVVVLEKDAQPGGCAKFSGGHMTVAGTHLQAKAGIEDHPDWLFRDMMDDGEGVAVPELIRTYVDGGPEHILWLEAQGVRFADEFQDDSNTDRISPGVARGHMIAASPDYPGGPHRGGLGLMLMLLRSADRKGVKLLLSHTMQRLLREGNGPVLGAEVMTSDGRLLTISARRAIVMAAGGWSGNAAMAVAEDPRITEDIFPDCWPYHLCLGEGHLASLDVGAQLINMAYGGYLMPRWGSRVYQIWEPPTFQNVPSIHTGLSIPDFRHIVLLDNRGLRFVNENLGNPKGVPLPGNPKFSYTPGSFPVHPFIEAYLNLPYRPRNVWAVSDAAGAKALGWIPFAAEIEHPNPKASLALYPGMVATASDLTTLAQAMQLPSEAVTKSIGQYNKFVSEGSDSEFHKQSLDGPVSQPPFYAARMALVKHTRRNGIRVNTRAQALDREALLRRGSLPLDQQTTIPRLYAAGECAHYLGRSHGHGTLGIYSFYGRIAGRNAARESAT